MCLFYLTGLLWSRLRRHGIAEQERCSRRDAGEKVLTLFNKLPGTPNPTYTWEDYVYREGQLLAAQMSDGTVKHLDLDHLGSPLGGLSELFSFGGGLYIDGINLTGVLNH